MSERKVINKYIPPNFDPSRIPRRQQKSTQHTVRLMAPFSMRCNSCGEYIYKGRKFNARKETVQGERYLNIRIFRFYIRCPQCAAEITYRTDPKNADYACEAGAKRNFEPWREEKAEEERAKTRKLLEELHNPMGALENKTYDSKREIDIVEALDEIRTINARMEHVDTDAIFERLVNEPEMSPESAERDYDAEDSAVIRDAFRKVQKQQEDPVIPKLSAKDLLLSAPTRSASSSLLGLATGSSKPSKLTAASLGIVPRKRSTEPTNNGHADNKNV